LADYQVSWHSVTVDEERQDARASLLYLIKRVELAVRKRLDEVLSEHGLTTTQYTALTALEGNPAMTAAALARHTFVAAQTIAQLVRTLEERGWVERRPDPSSRRQALLALTPAGARLLAELRGPVAAVERRMTEGLTAAEVRAVEGRLRAFRVALEP